MRDGFKRTVLLVFCYADTEGWLWLLHYVESRLLDRAVVLSTRIT